MFNFSKKYSTAAIDANEQVTEVSEKYKAAIKQIELLENELDQKTRELNLSCKAQHIMSEGVKNCVASLYTVQNQLQAVATHLDRSNKHILELMRKNAALKASGEAWFKRAIKLEFDVLTAKDDLRKIQNERDLAIKMCERLQSADKENSRDRHQP